MSKRSCISKATREWIAAGRPGLEPEAQHCGAAGVVIGDYRYYPATLPERCPCCGGGDVHGPGCDFIELNGAS